MKFNALHDQRYKGLQTEFEIVKEGKFLKQKIMKKSYTIPLSPAWYMLNLNSKKQLSARSLTSTYKYQVITIRTPQPKV